MQLRPFGDRLGTFVAAAIAIPALVVMIGYPTMLALNAAEMRRDAGAIGGFVVRANAARQGVTLAALEPLAYVRDADHDMVLGPMPLSAAKAKAANCCDPDSVEVIDDTMPAFAEIDESLRESAKMMLAARDK